MKISRETPVMLANASHIDDMVQIDAHAIGNSSRQLIVDSVKRGDAYVACSDGEIHGFLLLHHHWFGYPFIELLIVHPSRRRQGIGTLLMRHIESVYEATGKLFTSTNRSNITMQAVCEKLGYIRSGIIDNLDDDDPEVVYCKFITPPAAAPSASSRRGRTHDGRP